MYVCVLCSPGASGGQKRDLLELELQAIVIELESSGKATSAPNRESSLQSEILYIVLYTGKIMQINTCICTCWYIIKNSS